MRLQCPLVCKAYRQDETSDPTQCQGCGVGVFVSLQLHFDGADTQLTDGPFKMIDHILGKGLISREIGFRTGYRH